MDPTPAGCGGGSSGASARSTVIKDLKSTITRLGAGSFATVYVAEGGPCRAIKVVADPARADELQREFETLELIYAVCSTNKMPFFKLPKPYQFNSSFHAYAKMIGAPVAGVLDHPLYSMRRLLPVPAPTKNTIISSFFPQEHRDQCMLFICRLYLGPTRPTPKRFFNHLNFPLTPTMMEQLGLPVGEIAEGMGRMLTALAGRDGRDIEFVLGGDEEDELAYWCIDFNQMRAWSQVDQLVDSFYANDPYYPRPGLPQWEAFKAGYLQAACDAAKQFILAIEARAATGPAAAPPAPIPGP